MENGDSKGNSPDRSISEEFEGTLGEGENDINPSACFTGNEASTVQESEESTTEQSDDVETLRTHLESECVILVNGAANNAESCESKRMGCELKSERPQTNAVHDNELLELLELRFPTPPSASPNVEDINEEDCAPVSSDNVDSKTSSLSDIYTLNLAGSNLPSPLTLYSDKERLIWPLEEEFSLRNGQFKETVHYNLSIKLGEGAFGDCHLAVKVPDPADETDEERVFCVKKCQYRPNELLALHLAKKENIKEIVDFYGAKLQGRNASIFMEFMAGGTIAELIERQGNAQPWPVVLETFCYGYLEDVLKAVEFLHKKWIVHRDIKGNNVLLDENFIRAKLADFGSAESVNNARRSDDIWKTGCLLLEMLNGKRTLLFGVNDGGLQRQNSCRPEDHIPPEATPVTKYLLRLFFGIDTEDRTCLPTATEILKKLKAFQVTRQCSETIQ